MDVSPEMDAAYNSLNSEDDDLEALLDSAADGSDGSVTGFSRRLKTDKYGRRLDKHNIKKRLRYYIPILSWLPAYRKTDILYDILAGIAVACLLIPQSLSYASLADLDPMYGLYTSFVPIMVYIFLGTSRHVAVGPEAVVSIMTGAAIVYEEDPEERLALVAVLTCLVGLFTFALGLFRLGYLDCILSRATNRGFITGVAFVVIVEQLHRALGLQSHWEEGSSTLMKLIFIFEHISETQLYPCLFSFIGVALLMAFKFVRERYYSHSTVMRLFPSIMLLVIVSELLAWGFQLDQHGLAILGDIQGGFVTPRVPLLTSARVSNLLLSAVVISIVGFVESIIVAKEQANKHGYAISDNRELVAFGMMNILSCFFGGYPAFASMSRTSVADASGARTQVYGFVTGIIVLFAILFMLPAFKYLPIATQAAIVLYAAFNLIELHDLLFLWRIRAYSDIVMFAIIFFVTLLISVEVGIFVSILVSVGLVMKETTKPMFAVLGVVPGTTKYVEIGRHGATAVDGMILLQMFDSLYFANSGLLKDRLRRVELFGSLSNHPGDDVVARQLRVIVFDLERMQTIDASYV